MTNSLDESFERIWTIAESLHLHRATVEKHINAIFLACDLAEEKQVNKRVAAVLLFLRDA